LAIKRILLIEDNPADANIIREAFKEVDNIIVYLDVFMDSENAYQLASKGCINKDGSKPDLIILDLLFPQINGLEILKKLKSNMECKRIPVVVLTGSNSEKDLLEAYNNHANCLIQKPISFDGYVKIAQTLKNFWFGTVRLPVG
jgi:chemotaxis family two-component system response regulator Rcp1